MATPNQQEMTAPAPTTERSIDKFKKYANSPEVCEAFKRVLGSDKMAQMYVGSVVVQVYAKEELQKCSPKSIMVSAMRAAYLRLSVDPAMKQAHLVPYGNDATLIVDYHGLIQLMSNTGLYADINVSEVFEGEEVKTRRPSSKVEIVGERTSDVVKGHCAYFLMHNGIEKYLYMTNEECDAYAKANSKSYNNPKSPWNANGGKDRQAMRRKTVLRCLANRWGQYSPYATAIIKGDEDAMDAIIVNVPDEDQVSKLNSPQRSEAKLITSLGFEDERTAEQKQQEDENFIAWSKEATRHELESALMGGLAAKEREIVSTELSTRPADAEPLYRYNAQPVTMAVAQSWDEAPAKVTEILHELFQAGELPENLSLEEARLIQNPNAPTIEGIPA